MGNNEAWAYCGECGADLAEGTKACPKCGSTRKVFQKESAVAIGVKVTETRARQKRKGVRKFMKEMINRWKRSGDSRLTEGVHEERTIDKEKGKYDQVVKDAKTGEIIHEEHEPLREHKN